VAWMARERLTDCLLVFPCSVNYPPGLVLSGHLPVPYPPTIGIPPSPGSIGENKTTLNSSRPSGHPSRCMSFVWPSHPCTWGTKGPGGPHYARDFAPVMGWRQPRGPGFFLWEAQHFLPSAFFLLFLLPLFSSCAQIRINAIRIYFLFS